MSAEQHIQHGVNSLAVAIPTVSLISHAPEIVTVLTGILGIIWYSIIILEKVAAYRDRKKSPSNPEAPDPIPEYHKHD
jgi:hypothetical protein